jgi:hypothetical protein
MRMRRTVVGIYVYGGKAYLPVQARIKAGIFVDVEPVYSANLTVEDLVSAAEKVLAHGIAQIPDPTREEMRRHERPILDATKVSSWRALARKGTSYDVSWTDEAILLNMSRLTTKGAWEFDPEKMRTLPLGTTLPDIIAFILEDIATRPELK